MFRAAPPTGFTLLILAAQALVVIPLVLLACGLEGVEERPTREPRDRATETLDEQDDSESEDRSESSGLFGLSRGEGSVESDREALVAL